MSKLLTKDIERKHLRQLEEELTSRLARLVYSGNCCGEQGVSRIKEIGQILQEQSRRLCLRTYTDYEWMGQKYKNVSENEDGSLSYETK